LPSAKVFSSFSYSVTASTVFLAMMLPLAVNDPVERISESPELTP
jgi:hypothetical protein